MFLDVTNRHKEQAGKQAGKRGSLVAPFGRVHRSFFLFALLVLSLAACLESIDRSIGCFLVAPSSQVDSFFFFFRDSPARESWIHARRSPNTLW